MMSYKKSRRPPLTAFRDTPPKADEEAPANVLHCAPSFQNPFWRSSCHLRRSLLCRAFATVCVRSIRPRTVVITGSAVPFQNSTGCLLFAVMKPSSALVVPDAGMRKFLASFPSFLHQPEAVLIPSEVCCEQPHFSAHPFATVHTANDVLPVAYASI